MARRSIPIALPRNNPPIGGPNRIPTSPSSISSIGSLLEIDENLELPIKHSYMQQLSDPGAKDRTIAKAGAVLECELYDHYEIYVEKA